jgi:hypothetical protein
MKLKGYISKSLEIFIGVIIVVFFLIIIFNFLGMLDAYAYEQQAQQTAKRLQTKMNMVCAYPQGMEAEVEVELPQKLASKGSEMNPVDMISSALKGDVDAVTNAIRYTTSLQSYGDPWYVIYYEEFPEGEDTGWSGWSEVTAMRTTSTIFRGVEAITCAVPFHRLANGFKRIAKFSEGGVSVVGEKVAKTVIGKPIAKVTSKILSKAKAGVSVATKIEKIKKLPHEIGEKLFLREIYSGIANKVKVPASKIWAWIVSQGYTKLYDHFKEVPKVLDVAEAIPKITSKLKKSHNLDSKLDNAIEDQANKIIKGENINNLDVKEFFARNIKTLSDPSKTLDDRKEALYLLTGKVGIGDDFYDVVKNDMDKFIKFIDAKITTNIEPKYAKQLKSLAELIKDGKITRDGTNLLDIEEVAHLRAQLRNPGKTVLSSNEIDKVNNYLDEMEGYIELHSIGEQIDPDKLIAATTEPKPWLWSRAIYYKELAKDTIPGIPYITPIAKAGASGSKKPTVTRWGSWYLPSTFVFSQALSLTDISMLKFVPCSDHALCVKSQVNPSITVYPLEECKEAGIDYIELEKYPENPPKDLGDVFSTRNIESIFGAEATSKFYTASPCEGKLIIKRDKCKCSGKKVPYIDYTSQNVFLFDCKANDLNSIKCKITKYMDYIDETKDLGEIDNIPIIEKKEVEYGGETVKYKIKINFKDTILSGNLDPDDQDYAKLVNMKDVNEKSFSEFFNSLDLTCTKFISPDFSDKFNCSFSMPTAPFYTTECKGSNLWMECKNWEKGKTTEKDQPGLEEKKKIQVNEWCCTKWHLTAYGGEVNGTTRKIIDVSEIIEADELEDLITNSKCEDIYKRIDVENNIKTNIDNVLSEGGSNNIWKISDPQDYINSVKDNMIKVTKESSEIELEEGVDPNKQDINILFMYNLDPDTEIDCLKVKFVADETKGFCYSSPPSKMEEIKEIGTGVGAMIIETVGTGIGAAACGFFGWETGPGTVICAKGASLLACEVGNMVAWYGQNQIATDKENRLWPNNDFFGNYFID